MSGPNRLAADAAHQFGGIALDRSKPLSFKLNGRRIEGFAGDTILMAALAAGIDSVGMDGGSPLALDARYCPPIRVRGGRSARDILPMERTPAIDGFDVETVGPGGAAMPRAERPHSLGLKVEEARTELPWHNAAPEGELSAEIVIIGGGVAGLSAAEAAAAQGRTSIVIERRPWLGGDARFFGGIDNNETPEAMVSRLESKLETLARVRVLSRADALEINGSSVIVHQVDSSGDQPRSRVLAVTGRSIILATGSLQRLPVFAGNRRPGVVSAIAAYHRAKRYGVWRGRNALIITQSNYSYRLALRVNEAGVAIRRIVDSRLNPQSRFVDFSKASGFTLSTSLVPVAVTESWRGEIAVRIQGAGGAEQTITMENGQVVVSGGWQPDLSLWMRAGGSIAWDSASGQLKAQRDREGLALAGAAAGYATLIGCAASGRAAVARVLGKAEPDIDDTGIDARFETPDAPTPIAPPLPGRTYLDGGNSLIVRPGAEGGTAERFSALNEARALGLGDVAAAVQLQLIEPADAGIIADERGAAGGEIRASDWKPANAPAPIIPHWLDGRFGAQPILAVLIVDRRRRFEAGALVYSNTSEPRPTLALGVILGPDPAGGPGGLALLSSEQLKAVDRFIVRTERGPAPARITRRVELSELTPPEPEARPA